jgi:hypothetical protein
VREDRATGYVGEPVATVGQGVDVDRGDGGQEKLEEGLVDRVVEAVGLQ